MSFCAMVLYSDAVIRHSDVVVRYFDTVVRYDTVVRSDTAAEEPYFYKACDA